MIRRLCIAMAALCLGTAPAFAYPSCLAGGGPGLRIEFGASFGTGKFSEQDDMDFLLLQARSRASMPTRPSAHGSTASRSPGGRTAAG
jgi:hypothetical protein